MEIKLSKNELETFVELIYLGNWIANSTKSERKEADKYEKLFCKIISQNFSENADFNEEELHDRLIEVIEDYDSNILFSELAKQYADYQYPITSSNTTQDAEIVLQYIKNTTLREAYEEELKTNQFKNVTIQLPDLSEVIKKKLDNYKI